jgi:hypothetical protein
MFALLAGIELGWKGMARKNALAYLASGSVMKKKVL